MMPWAEAGPIAKAPQPDTALTITCRPGGQTISTSSERTVLEALLAGGVSWPYGCQHGMCGACKAKLVSGSIDPGLFSSLALLDAEREEGLILPCCAKPLSDLVIEEVAP